MLLFINQTLLFITKTFHLKNILKIKNQIYLSFVVFFCSTLNL